MKISEAIRKGCEMSNQCYGQLFRVREFEHETGFDYSLPRFSEATERGGILSCAIGAAAMGVVGRGANFSVLMAEARRIMDILRDFGLKQEVVYRNDNLRHTREQIADFLMERGL